MFNCSEDQYWDECLGSGLMLMIISQTESNYITTAAAALPPLYQEADFHDCELSEVTFLLLETLNQSSNPKTQVNQC